MLSSSAVSVLSSMGIVTMALGALSCAYIAWDQRRRPIPAMPVMQWVWPINALWAGPLAIWAYRSLGVGRLPVVKSGERRATTGDMVNMPDGEMGIGKPEALHPTDGQGDMVHEGKTISDRHAAAALEGMPGMDDGMADRGMAGHASRPFWQSVVTGTLHCGAGCTLADLIGPWLFRLFPFIILGRAMYGEWTLDYVLALIIGVGFQYAGLASMTRQRGAALWWQAFKVDFLSLTAWQVGMYGWMAIAMFRLVGPMEPDSSLFWFMMQISMACGFVTAYPMNHWLIRSGIKTAM